MIEALRAWRRRHDQLNFLRRLARDRGCSMHVRRRFVAVRRDSREIRISRANAVYAQDLIYNFDYYFDIVEPRREGARQVVDYSRPALHTMRDDGLRFWFPELAESMETTALYLDYAHLEPGQTVLDLGGYAGGAAYHFLRAVGGSGRVFAFEPDARSYDCLRKNIALHQLDNVVAEPRGVWSQSGRTLFQAEGNMGSAVVEASARSSDTKTWIDVVSLDDYCREQHIERVDFVKMDIEGSEAAILESAGAFIARYRPAMIIEVHEVQGVRTDAAVTRALEAHGYEVTVVEQAGLALPLLYARPR
ncbi:MAG: FkbM family methyltransferase [Acidobacteria bacterium]|nr:FkbM family methyltransferase [Acidobacteriota bacterium]